MPRVVPSVMLGAGSRAICGLTQNSARRFFL